MDKLFRKIRRWSSRTSISAIRENDLEEWLNQLGVLESLQSGDANCIICKKSLDLNSLQLVGKINNKIVFCCSDSNCVLTFSELVRGEQK